MYNFNVNRQLVIVWQQTCFNVDVYSTELLQKIKTWSIGPAHVMLLCVGLATVTFTTQMVKYVLYITTNNHNSSVKILACQLLWQVLWCAPCVAEPIWSSGSSLNEQEKKPNH